MQLTKSILDDANLIQAEASTEEVAAIAGLIAKLALQVMENQAVAATNEARLDAPSIVGLPVHAVRHGRGYIA